MSTPTAASVARVYDFLLGGSNNFEADREAGRRMMAAKPDLQRNVRANRRFLARAVRYLAAEAGIRQFLDIGTGLPTMDSTHEVAQGVASACRVVYVDNDPAVLAMARGLLDSTPDGAAEFVQGDLRDPGGILALAGGTLDPGQPTAIMCLGILHLVEDGDRPRDIIGRLAAAAVPGSYLVISHPASDIHAGAAAAGARVLRDRVGRPQTNRSREQVARLLDGLDIIDPGVVPLNRWRPGPGDSTDEVISSWAAAARKA